MKWKYATSMPNWSIYRYVLLYQYCAHNISMQKREQNKCGMCGMENIFILTMCLFSFFATISVRKLTETVAYELDCCWKMFMNSIIIGFASSECLIWSSIVSLFLMLICVQYIYIRLVGFEYDSTYYGITHLVHWMRSKTPPHSVRLSSSADQIQSQICIASTNYTFLSTYLSQ